MFIFMLLEDFDNAYKSKFEQLYYKYKNILFFTAYNIVKNHADAEDVLQNSFLKIAKNIKSVGQVDSKETLSFLIVITKNTAYDYIRKNFSKQEIPLESIERTTDFDECIEKVLDNLEYKTVVGVIKSIDSPYNEVLYLHYVMDYSLNKTAKLLKRKVSTVKMQLVRGKKILLDKLSEVSYE